MTATINHFDNAPATRDASAPAIEGFDQEFEGVVDYILRITYRIWEGKQIGLCYDYYSDDCPVWTLAGYAEGVKQVVENTLKTLSSFPDRTLHAENIIWDGDNERGYHSSHLILTHMTNTGASEYGPATGRSAKFWVIAHCVMKDNKIVEEWLVRDNYALVEQLGLDPHEVAKGIAAKPLDPESTFAKWLSSETQRVAAISTERLNSSVSAEANPEGFIKHHLHNIWNARLLGDMNLMYHNNAVFHGSANREFVAIDQILGFYLDILGAMPDAKFSSDYVNSVDNQYGGKDVAVRWGISGTHTGYGKFGRPTGKPIFILGESHFRMKDGKVMEEWTVFDELSILAQAYRNQPQLTQDAE